MKKFKFDPVKRKDSLNSSSKKLESAKPEPKEVLSKQEVQKGAKKSQIQREIEMLNEKISATTGNIKQTQKLLDIDVFLKKQKEKRLDYAKKLNEQYDRQKRERQKKIYKQNQRQSSQTVKLQQGVIRSEIPLSIFGAIDQIEKGDSAVKKWILEDHYHKLDEILLDKTKSELFGQNMRKTEEQCLKQKSDHVWKRCKEVTANSAQIKYFPIQVNESQLQPSDFGEALISVLTLMPQSLSETLYQECSDVNREKYFLLSFYPGGEKKVVLTDEWIEVREFVHKFVNVGSRSKDNLSFWSSIMQKGVKKLYHKQKIMSTLPEMCQLIYGLDPELIPLNNKGTIRQNIPNILNTLLKNHPKALIGFINDQSETHQRIYPLIDIHFPEVHHHKKKKHKEPEHKGDILYELKNPYAGNLLSSNFINKFTITQLYEKFNRMIVLRELPKKWGGIRIFIDFLSNGPISFTGNSWTKNNQYSFTLNKASQIRLALRRRWGSYINSSQQQTQDSSIHGYMLFKSQEGETEISVLKLDALVYKSKSSDEGGCLLDTFLEKGTYILIPYSHSVSQQFMQLMNLDIIAQREDIISLNKSKINDYYYSNQEVNQQKVIQKLHSKVKYQKPKYEKIKPPRLFLERGEKNISIAHIESLGLTLMKEAKNQDFFQPGQLKKLLLNDQFKEEKKEKTTKKSAQNEEIQRYEKEQTLKILLGYDALMGEQINYGHMKSIVEETSDQVDFANYHLGQQGIMALLEPLMQMPRIVKLNLAQNALSDNAITYLCYYLEKGNRKQLRQLDLGGNPVGKMGVRALKGLTEIYQDLKIVGVKL